MQNETIEHQSDCISNTRYGALEVPKASDDLIASFLRHYGEWAFLETKHIASYLPKDARVLDVGAYLGTFSLGLSQATGLSSVTLVEANDMVVPFLRNNVKRNLRCSTEIVHALIVDPAGPLPSSGRTSPGNAGSASFSGNSEGTEEIPLPETVLSFAALIDRFGPFDLVKLDVEGMEEALLASCRQLLDDPDTLIWVECNENPFSLSLAKLLLETGRPLTFFAWPSHNPKNFLDQNVELLPFAHEAGLLLGSEPRPFTRDEQAAGCMSKIILTIEDLREAMWHTPRWAPREWKELDIFQIAAVNSHSLIGHERESFLLQPPNPNKNPDTKKILNDLHRIKQLNEFKIIQLRAALATVTEKMQVSELTHGKRLAELSKEKDEIKTAAQQELALMRSELNSLQESSQATARHELTAVRNELQHDLAISRAELADARTLHDTAVLRADSVSNKLKSVQDSFDALRTSLTWRLAVRMSREIDRVPMLKKLIRSILRR